MKKKNKIIALFLTALCVASLLGGCGKGSENAVSQDADKAPAKKNTAVTLNEVAHSILYPDIDNID